MWKFFQTIDQSLPRNSRSIGTPFARPCFDFSRFVDSTLFEWYNWVKIRLGFGWYSLRSTVHENQVYEVMRFTVCLFLFERIFNSQLTGILRSLASTLYYTVTLFTVISPWNTKFRPSNKSSIKGVLLPFGQNRPVLKNLQILNRWCKIDSDLFKRSPDAPKRAWIIFVVVKLGIGKISIVKESIFTKYFNLGA